MIVALIGREKIYKLILPQNIDGDYLLGDEELETRLVNIKGVNGCWQVRNGNNITITNANNQPFVILKEYLAYAIKFNKTGETFILYCMPTCENNYSNLKINNLTEFTIGNSQENDIFYNTSMVAQKHAKLSYKEGNWEIENLDSRYVTFVNDIPINSERKKLENGDIIFIMGFKIVIMGETIFINNPSNRVAYNLNTFTLNKIDINNPENVINKNDENCTNKEAFFRTPRVINKIETQNIKLDAPPQMKKNEEDPLLLIIGPSIIMGIASIMTTISTISGQVSGTASGFRTFASILMTISLLTGMIIFPIVRKKYREKKLEKYEEKREEKYTKYLNDKRKVIDELVQKTKDELFANYISAEECEKIVTEKSPRLLERKIKDYDFLSLRLGIGDIISNIELQNQEETFTLDEDELFKKMQNFANEYKTLKTVPIILSLVENNMLSILGKDSEYIDKYVQNLIVQLISLQDYDNLKLVFLLKKDTEKKYEYVKTLPHIWDNTKETRFFATNDEDIKDIAHYLEEKIHNKTQVINTDKKYFQTHYLIITDCYEKISNLGIVKEIIKAEENIGFSLMCISNELENIPSECQTIINIKNNEEASIYKYDNDTIKEQAISIDISKKINLELICKEISNVQTSVGDKKEERLLPNNLSFLEMYNIGLIEQLNILKRWKENDSTESLKALIGIDDAGMPIILDIHEKKHGPHGLIAGSTGSGKSELIITYVLSLALNYHPDDVTFVLIDYKGGGLAGAFQKKDIKLPHLVGTITNIDINGLTRSLASIKSEVKRRQIVFNEVRDMTDEGTIDIYKYQKLYHDGKIKEPMPHLLIICDEFAELKQQQPDFMSELISVSRIGRSLGIHLILATQKPGGIVDEQIRSNSRFGICLKVQEKSDSTDVIRRPDAINLKRAGQFYMQVGNDEYFVLGQSGWAGAQYIPIDKVQDKKIDNAINFINNIGQTTKKVDNSEIKVTKSKGEQLTNIVEYLHYLAMQQNIKKNKIWLEDLEPTILLENLRKKYNVTVEKNNIVPIIGEYDNPEKQEQGLVEIDLSQKGNAIIYGNAESGKETLLSTMVYDIITTHSSDEVNLYLFDFGTESLKAFKDCAHVGDVVFINDKEKISRFFEMMQEEIKKRKEILSDYGGDYKLYLSKSNEPMPMIIMIMNNYDAFVEMYQIQYDDVLLSLTREGIKYGIIFVVTLNTVGSIRYRLANNFKNKFALQLNKEQEYAEIFDKVRKKKPSNIFGRGLIELPDESICEFQTSKICETDLYYELISNKIAEVNAVNNKAKRIPILPDIIPINELMQYAQNLNSIPVGINPDKLETVSYDFSQRTMNIITAKEGNDAIEFLNHITQEIKQLKDIECLVLNAESADSKELEKIVEVHNNFVEKSSNNKVVIITGIANFINEFEKNDDDFGEFIEENEDKGKINYIFADSENRFKEIEFCSWYKRYISNENGIWVGNGGESQYTINLNLGFAVKPQNDGRTYGYVAKNGKSEKIKLVEMRDDKNEG